MGSRLAIILALLTSAAFVGVGLMSFNQQTAKTRPIVFPWDVFWCNADDDCLTVDKIGCCGCWQGGGQAAVSSTHANKLRRFLKHACHGKQACVQIDLCRKDLEPRCIARQCTLVSANEGPPMSVAPTAMQAPPPDPTDADTDRSTDADAGQ